MTCVEQITTSHKYIFYSSDQIALSACTVHLGSKTPVLWYYSPPTSGGGWGGFLKSMFCLVADLRSGRDGGTRASEMLDELIIAHTTIVVSASPTIMNERRSWNDLPSQRVRCEGWSTRRVCARSAGAESSGPFGRIAPSNSASRVRTCTRSASRRRSSWTGGTTKSRSRLPASSLAPTSTKTR